MKNQKLDTIYKKLFEHYGDPKWWPARSRYEVMVGAVLTQNTAWSNVEMAIERLGEDLTPDAVYDMPLSELEERIRPAGFYKQKSQYLKAVTEWFLRYSFDARKVKEQPLEAMRKELLRVRGVGNETADSILLYAFDFPTFVIDAYTMRLFDRYPVHAGQRYMEVKAFMEKRVPRDVILYNRFHALIVKNGEEHCKKKPICKGCPLKDDCKRAKCI